MAVAFARRQHHLALIAESVSERAVMRSPMYTVLAIPPMPVMNAGRARRSRAALAVVSTAAPAPAERGQMSNSL